MVKLNPQAPIEYLFFLYDAIASWQQPPPPLDEMFEQIVLGYKRSIQPDQWAAFCASWTPYMAEVLPRPATHRPRTCSTSPLRPQRLNERYDLRCIGIS